MSVRFTMEAESLNSMKYRDLQKLAKKNGMKANLRKVDMVEQLLKEEVEVYYEVEKILDKRSRGSIVEYLVKWLGFDNDWNTWQPAEILMKNAGECVGEFLERQNEDIEIDEDIGDKFNEKDNSVRDGLVVFDDGDSLFDLSSTSKECLTCSQCSAKTMYPLYFEKDPARFICDQCLLGKLIVRSVFSPSVINSFSN